MGTLRHLHSSRPAAFLVCLLAVTSASAQTNRIHGPIDHFQTVAVAGQQSPLARAEFDRGAVAPDFVLPGMTLRVERTVAQQRELDQLLEAQQNPGSPQYHKWLTPEQFATRFGASADDLGTLRQWLESQGFQIRAVARGGSFIRFDGTAAQVRRAFGTEIHYFAVNGVRHYANAGAPGLPRNLAPLVMGIGGLDDFGPHPHHMKFAAGKVGPQYSYGASSNALAPGDVATIYDISAAYGEGWSGEGQTIVIIAASDITASDVALYSSTFDLELMSVQVVHPDKAPGLVSTPEDWALEATMDLELAGAIAPGAQLLLDADANVWNALDDAVDNLRGQTISMSFGTCEAAVSSSAALSYRSMAQQANAQGITLIASSGDSGGAGCDSAGASVPIAATQAAAVQLPAAFPEVTGVGGTEFNEGGGSYWGASTSNGGTATGYIPETTWNDIQNLDGLLYASGGGVSTLFAKPTWQTGNTPADLFRDVPDIALAASAYHDGYVIAMNGMLSTAANSPYTMGGTSAGAPVMAGIVAVLNSGVYDDSSGNINPILYNTAAGSSYGFSASKPAFHDIATGSNLVAVTGGGEYGYDAGLKYDQATGLGSVDVAELNKAWADYHTAPAVYGLSPTTAKPGASSALAVDVTGDRFQSGDSVLWTFNGVTSTLASSYISAGSMSATVPANLLAKGGTAQIQVLNSSGLYSNAAQFTIASATVTSLSPSHAVAGGSAFTLTVNGTGFVSGAKILWNSTPVTTTFSSATMLTGSISQAMIASSGSASVAVMNADGTTSIHDMFEIEPGTPTLTSLSPSSALAGGNDVTLTVNGTGFSGDGVEVLWGSTILETTYISGTQLTATVTSMQLASAGSGQITVKQYGYGSGGEGSELQSNALTFTVNGPTISKVSPAIVAVGSSSTTLTVTGTSFVAGTTSGGTFTPGSLVYVGGTTELAVTAGTSSSITATLPALLLESVGTLSVTVVNPNLSASSNAVSVSVAAPAIAAVSPKSITAGASGATLTVTGTNFIAGTTSGGTFTAGSVVYVGSTALTVTAGTATSITATVPGSMLESVGTLSATVETPNVSTASSAATVTVAAPAISAVSPKTITAGASGATLTVTGTNFIAGTTSGGTFTAGSVVYVGSTALTVTAGTATSITATVPGSMLESVGSLSVTVQNPNVSTASSAAAVSVAAPAISAVNPKTIAAGASGATLTVTGTNFIAGTTSGGTFTAGSLVYVGKTALTVSAGTATSITATLTSDQLESAGSLSITVGNPNVTTASNASTVSVVGPAITAVSPKTLVAGSASATLTVTGTNFIAGTTSGGTFTAGSLVYIGKTALTVTAGTATSITATVPGSLLGSVGTLSVTVENPNVSTASGAASVSVVGPVISSVSPKSITAGTSSATLTVTGTNFVPGTTSDSKFTAGSTVYVGETLLTATAGTATSITATIPGSLLTSAGSLSLTVQNPSDSATSSAATITVTAK